MEFTVIEQNGTFPGDAKDKVFLQTDGWDDWFKFNTMYVAFYFDKEGGIHRIGEVKIGEFGLTSEKRTPNIPANFTNLGGQFFSVGQDDSYYDTLNRLGEQFRNAFLTAMRDIALDSELFERALEEEVTGVSLLRSVSVHSVRGQYHRMAHGGARLTGYTFSYTPPPWGKDNNSPTFTFEVIPESYPPTNVHVLIGRNNVGKTYTVDQLTKALVNQDQVDLGELQWKGEAIRRQSENFSNVVSITFSAFDPFEPLPVRQNKLSSAIQYHYIGLKHTSGDAKAPKSADDLAKDFGWSVQAIFTHSAKRERWKNALAILESDPIFNQAEIWKLADENDELHNQYEAEQALVQLRERARHLYKKLSSGHKIVVLTITRLVETLEERSLVLMDEPEAHLHPPLLSAFIRSLSNLLTNRNGVAIIATHSPVILQEVPKTCVWKISRVGREKKIARPDTETFGENVGALTHAIFGLEVTKSGFHKMVADAVEEGLSFDDILKRFDGQLGGEARGIAQSLIAVRDQEHDTNVDH